MLWAVVGALLKVPHSLGRAASIACVVSPPFPSDACPPPPPSPRCKQRPPTTHPVISVGSHCEVEVVPWLVCTLAYILLRGCCLGHWRHRLAGCVYGPSSALHTPLPPPLLPVHCFFSSYTCISLSSLTHPSRVAPLHLYKPPRHCALHDVLPGAAAALPWAKMAV
jgi:hypothetical protein